MRTLRTFVFLFVVLSFASCKSKSKTPNTGGEQIPTDNSMVSENVRLQVSFYSIGAGIDYVTQEKYKGWLDNHSPKVKYDETHWGREGEINYCMTLSELNKKEQEKFVADTKEFLSKSILVHINENVVCEHKK